MLGKLRSHYLLWILDTWVKVSISSIIQAFIKAGIITEQLGTGNSNETNLRDLGILDAEIAQLLNSDTEDEEFGGFMEEE